MSTTGWDEFIYLSVLVAVVVTEANVVASQGLWPRSLRDNAREDVWTP